MGRVGPPGGQFARAVRGAVSPRGPRGRGWGGACHPVGGAGPGAEGVCGRATHLSDRWVMTVGVRNTPQRSIGDDCASAALLNYEVQQELYRRQSYCLLPTRAGFTSKDGFFAV